MGTINIEIINWTAPLKLYTFLHKRKWAAGKEGIVFVGSMGYKKMISRF